MTGKVAGSIVGVAALTLAACNPILGPTKVDSAWVTIERGRFTFNVRSGSFAEQSIDTITTVLDDQFVASVRALDLRYDGHITFFLYTSGADAGFGDDPMGGNSSGVAYTMTETVKTAVLPPLDGGRLSLLQHEMNHVIFFNGLGSAGTSFVTEGLASALLSERFHSSGPTFFHRWAATHRGQLVRLAELVDDDRWRSSDSQVAYNSSASFLAYLVETYGSAPLRRIYQASSADFGRAFRDTYGVTLDTAETAWHRFLETGR